MGIKERFSDSTAPPVDIDQESIDRGRAFLDSLYKGVEALGDLGPVSYHGNLRYEYRFRNKIYLLNPYGDIRVTQEEITRDGSVHDHRPAGEFLLDRKPVAIAYLDVVVFGSHGSNTVEVYAYGMPEPSDRHGIIAIRNRYKPVANRRRRELAIVEQQEPEQEILN